MNKEPNLKNIKYQNDNSYEEKKNNGENNEKKENKDKKVHFSQNIEMSNEIINLDEIRKENELKKKDTEDEDILTKFKKKRRKHLNKNNFKREEAFSMVKHQIRDEFSLNKLGKIIWAKEHASANRPMNKIKDFTTETNFCNCCNLPCETSGIMEPFSCCEKTEKFAICGKAVPLYFFFIRYCILCLAIVLFIMSVPITLLNTRHLFDIEDFCIHNKKNFHNKNEIEKICTKYLPNKNNDFTIWFSRVSSENILDYQKLLNYTTDKIYQNSKLFVNFSSVGFLCMASLFIINIFFIILFKAKVKTDKKGNVQPSDYTLLITDLQKIVNEFKEKQEEREYSLNENNAKDDLTGGVSDYEYINMNYLKTQIGQFTQFLIDNLFYSQKTKQNLNIFNINLCYKLNEFMILKEKQEKCKYKIFQVENNPYQIAKNNRNNYLENNRRYYTSPFTFIGLDWLCCSNKGKLLKELIQERDIYENNLNSLVTKAKLNNFCGCIFATFNTIKDKEEFYEKFPHFFLETIIFYIKNIKYYLCCCFISKESKAQHRTRKRIRVYLAPEPEDVIWENMEFTVFQRFYRIIIVYTLSLALISIAFYAVYHLNAFQKRTKQHYQGMSQYIASFSISIVISILNIILEFIMKFFTKMEKQKSMTKYYLSYSIKLTIFTFTTSAIVPFISDYLNSDSNEHSKNNSDNNLITNMFFLFLTNSFISPVVWTLNISLIIKKIRIYLIERKKVPDSMHFKTQKELNELYEYPDMDIASKYSYIYKTILMTMFYLPIFPLGVPISLLGLLLAYYLEKFNFTHSYKRPEMLNEKLGEFYFSFFIFASISYSIGNYFFMKDIFDDKIWPLLNISIFSFLAIIPYTKPISYFFKWNKHFDIDSKPINDIYFTFCNDYQRQNPFTKKEGMYFYVNELKKRGYISKFIYDILIKNIEKINVMEIYYKSSLNPNLKEAQRKLIMNNIDRLTMEDLKKSITRVFQEKVMNKKKKDNIENEKRTCFSNDSSDGRDSSESSDSVQTHTLFNMDLEDSMQENMNRRNTEMPRKTKMEEEYIDNNNKIDKYFYSRTIGKKGSFLIKQYKDPLLLSIGQGLKNIAFLDNNNDIDYDQTKNNSINDEEDSSEGGDINIIISDFEGEEQD